VITWQDLHSTRAASLFRPAVEFLGQNGGIPNAAESRNRAAERPSGRKEVRLTDGEVGSQQREHKTHQVWILKHLFTGAVPPSEFSGELRIGKLVGRTKAVWQMWGAMAGDKQRCWLKSVQSPDLAAEFKGD